MAIDTEALAAQLEEWARNFEPGECRFEAAEVMVRNFENRHHLESKVLGLKGFGLKSLPEEIAHFTHLVKLDLSDNPIHQLPAGLAKLVNIQQVLVSSRHLQNAANPVDSIAGLNALSALSASTKKSIWLTVHMDNSIRGPYSDLGLIESMAFQRFKSDATDRTRENTSPLESP
ncbi:MAG: hypothetical protein QE278_14035 [Limnobacter sp.]|nr:hypothetical protein [Limnobacter sp.]